MNLIGARVGNYVIERPLKKGGMGSVYVALHPRLNRQVAIKFLETDMSSRAEFSQRFVDEARITAGLNHPNVVDIFDFGELNGRFYYVMELLNGYDLQDAIAGQARFTVEHALQILVQICRGLNAAHDAGIVHRDLKPANIFLLEGSSPRIKLMDFGVAKVLSTASPQTNYGQILGTPAYMAPEQAMGDLKNISAQTDLYALGVIAYELLSGRRPFTHEAPMMLLVAHIHEEHPRLLEVAPQLPHELSDLVERCLDKNPSRRPESAQALGARLEEFTAPLGPASESQPGPTGSKRWPSNADEPHHTEALGSANTVDEETLNPFAPTLRQAEPKRVEQPSKTTSLPSTEAPSQQEIVPLVEPHSPLVQPRSARRPAQPPPSESSQPSESPASASLTDTERGILHKLLGRMRRKGDLPAFVQNVGDVSKKADFQGKFSANQLSEAILKDHALTAKLLRIVNTHYLNRFGGKIYSVQQAIVILGFEQVRSLAMGISVFDKTKDGANGERIAESSFHSLVSGEIARSFCKNTNIKDSEKATVCSMFQNLGKHLAIVYLPECYDRAVARAQKDNISLDRAADRELGLSFRKIGIGVAEEWHLPQPMLDAMVAQPYCGQTLQSDSEHLAALAQVSNEFCDLIAGGLDSADDPKLHALLKRNENFLKIEPEAVAELLSEVKDSFRSRYSSLLGRSGKGSGFLGNLNKLLTPPADKKGTSVRPQTKGTRRNARPKSLSKRPKERPRNRKKVGRLAVQSLSLGQTPTPAVKKSPAKPSATQTETPTTNTKTTPEKQAPTGTETDIDPREKARAIRILLNNPSRCKEALPLALSAVSTLLNLPRVFALRANDNATELIVAQALGPDTQELTTQLHFPLAAPRVGGDVFSKAFHSSKDILIKDTYSDKAGAQVPSRFYEALGSPALALIVCKGPKGPPTLLLADVSDPLDLPSRQQIKSVDCLKLLIGEAAA